LPEGACADASMLALAYADERLFDPAEVYKKKT
jgi:hypothetical protein